MLTATSNILDMTNAEEQEYVEAGQESRRGLSCVFALVSILEKRSCGQISKIEGE